MYDWQWSTMGKYGLNSNNAVNELECRTCLNIMSPDAVLFNIFEMWSPPWDGMAETIAEDLEKLANVKVHKLDRHPKLICRSCYELLHSACSFTTLIKHSDEILQHRYRMLEEEIDKAWPKPIQIVKSINSSMYENSMNVEIKQEAISDNEYDAANGIYENEEDFAKLDIKVEPEELIQQQPSEQFTVNGKPLDTFGDGMTHLTNGIGEEHLLNKIKDEPLSEEELEPMHTDLPLKCLLCAKDFEDVTDLKAHVIAQHSYKSVKRKTNNGVMPVENKCNYVCPICRQCFTSSAELTEHESKSICYGCNESFDTFELLTKHRQTCKALSKASQEVKKLKTLDSALRTQSPEQTELLKCTQCEETFTDMYYMTIHQEIHHSSPSKTTDFLEEGVANVDSLKNIFSDDSNS